MKTLVPPIQQNMADSPQNLTCSLCKLVLSDRKCLQQHIMTDHSELNLPSVQPLKCQLCHLTFSTLTKMNKHQKMKHKFTCQEEDCFIKFVSRVKLEEHIEGVHKKSLSKSNRHMCHVCGQVVYLFLLNLNPMLLFLL